MESQRHWKATVMLSEPLELFWSERRDFFIGTNMFLYFSALQAKKNDFRGPDFFVVLDTTRGERESWIVWEENGKGPDLVVELLSESTRAEDRGPKKRVYERVLRVSEYFLYDPFTGVLDGFRLDSNLQYAPISFNDAGRMESLSTGLELGIWNGSYHGIQAPWLRWFRADGSMLPTNEELKEAAQAARTEADAARTEADVARTEADAARAEADAERKRRLELEAVVAQLTAAKT